MFSVTNFVQHYIATYNAYLHSPIIYQVLFVYVVFMTLSITAMFKWNKMQYFFPVLFTGIIPSSAIYTYTFWSLW